MLLQRISSVGYISKSNVEEQKYQCLKIASHNCFDTLQLYSMYCEMTYIMIFVKRDNAMLLRKAFQNMIFVLLLLWFSKCCLSVQVYKWNT